MEGTSNTTDLVKRASKVKSTFLMSQRAGRGKIINMASIAGGKIGVPTASVCCASKGVIVSLTQALAVVLPPHLKAMLDITPWGRTGETRDITSAAIYLASDESVYVTGLQFVIDGGCSCP